MKHGIISLIFALLLFLSSATQAGEKSCFSQNIDPMATKQKVKEVADATCPKACKEWACTSFGHGHYTGQYETTWRTQLFCRCHYDY